MSVTMLVTFEISEESLSTRNDCKKFPKLSQTSFSGIVYFTFKFQSSSVLPFGCTLTQPLIMSLQNGKVLHVEYLTTGLTSQCVFEAVVLTKVTHIYLLVISTLLQQFFSVFHVQF